MRSSNKPPTSHPASRRKASDLEFITIGRILAPRGVKGKLKVKVETDFPQRFTRHANVYIDRQVMTIDSAEQHRGNLVIKLDTIDRIEDAQKLRGKIIEIPHSQVYPLPEGEYYHFQLIGLEVWTTGGKRLGNVTEVMPTESNDVYIVHCAREEILIPAIEDVVKSIDLDKGCLVIEPISGLLSSNETATS
ncbi:ribosome maturation factor RimM [Chloroflexota bacterium]